MRRPGWGIAETQQIRREKALGFAPPQPSLPWCLSTRSFERITRLVYYVSDRSMRTVEQWRERAGQDCCSVELGTCDATDPGRFLSWTGETFELTGLRAVVCNHVLDVLPATVLRRGPAGAEELFIRTHLTEDRSLLAQYSRLSPDEIRRLAQSDDSAGKARLIPLILKSADAADERR